MTAENELVNYVAVNVPASGKIERDPVAEHIRDILGKLAENEKQMVEEITRAERVADTLAHKLAAERERARRLKLALEAIEPLVADDAHTVGISVGPYD